MTISIEARKLVAKGALLLGSVYAICALTADRWNPLPHIFGETRTGTYQGYGVRATEKMDTRRVILYPIDREGKIDGLQQLIGRDYSSMDDWDSTKFLYTPKDSKLRALDTDEHLQSAWEAAWDRKK